MKGFGWDIENWETPSRWGLVEGSPQRDVPPFIAGAHDLGEFLARIESRDEIREILEIFYLLLTKTLAPRNRAQSAVGALMNL
jgi:hypothetical protein